MAEPTYLPTFDVDVENISKLSNLPNEDDGLGADELKATFDKAGVDIKEYLNSVALPAIEEAIAAMAGGGVPTGIDGNSIANGTITSMKLSNAAGQEAVTTQVIRDGAVTADKLGADIRDALTDIPDKINAWTQLINQYTEDFEGNFYQSLGNLQDHDEVLDGQVETLQDADTTINGRIDTLAAEVHGESGTGGVQEDIADLKAEDVAIKARLDTAEGTISTHNTDIANLQEADDDIDDRVTVLENAVNGSGVDAGILAKLNQVYNAYTQLNNTYQSLLTTINNLPNVYQKKHKQVDSIDLSSGRTSWTVTLSSAQATSAIFASPAAGSYDDWRDYGVRLSGQGDGYLQFTAAATTPRAINVNVVIFDV